jgi:endonuclease-3 related protein
LKETPLVTFYELLLARWGSQGWWPADTPFEMMLGAILTQNTAWRNVEYALDRLRAECTLEPLALEALPQEILAECIRPAGYFNQKSRAIKEMATTLKARFNGSVENLFKLETSRLRQELLSWRGVGPETADSILLYAANRPVFVIDAYTRRFLFRHGLCEEKTSYGTLSALFMDALPSDPALFNEYHALIVRLGKEHCKSKPQCEKCPLALMDHIS